MFQPGDIISGKFPYTDKEAVKHRMFLIVAKPTPKFVWGVMITKEENLDSNDGSVYIINPNEIDFELPHKSVIRMSILMTVSCKVINKKNGNLLPETLERVLYYIKNVLNIEL